MGSSIEGAQGAVGGLPDSTTGPVGAASRGMMEMRGYPTLVDTSDAAKDDALAERLWKVSGEMTRVNYEVGQAVAS
jgi:hypothetical protein